MGKDGDDGMRMFTTCGDRRHRLVFYKRVDEPILHFPYQFISQLGNTTNFSSLLYDIIFIFILVCKHQIRFGKCNRADIIFSNKTRGGKILPLRR